MAGEFIQAMRLHQKGEVAEAEAIYVRLLRERPDHAGAWQLLGVALHQRGEHEAALDLIGQAISLDPGKATFHNNYGAVLLDLGRVIEAIGCFQYALQIRPDYSDARSNLERAESQFRKESRQNSPRSYMPDFPVSA